MDHRSPLLVSVLCALAACADMPEAARPERVGRTQSALDAEPKPPEREIAIVIDGSGNVDPHCDWDPDSWTYTDDGYGNPIPLKPTRVICDDFDGFAQQRQGLIGAIQTHVPLGGKMALSVLLSASRQDEYIYLGPPVIVPYTVIRTQADKDHVIDLLRQMQVATARGIPGPDPWRPDTTHRCRHNYDPARMPCPSNASHAWAVNTALATLQAGPPAPTDPDAGPHVRAASREICIAGDLGHSVPPSAYWTQYVSTTGSLPPVQWPEGIPEEAKYWAPFESALSVDRFVAIELTQGISSPADLSMMARGQESPFWFDWDWGAILTLEGEVSADQSQLVIALNEIHEDATSPIPVQPPLSPITLTLTKGMTAQEVASQLNDLLWASQGIGYARLPVISALAENEVLFAANMHHSYQGSTQLGLGSVQYYPHIQVLEAPPGMTATLQGGSQTQPARTIEYEHLSVQEAYGRLISGCAEVIFPSGRMATHPLASEQQRTFDYAAALSECFDENAEPAPGAEGVTSPDPEPAPAPPGGGSGGDGTGGTGGTAGSGSDGTGGSSSSAGRNYCLDKPRLVAIEVNQVIQDWNNTVPLIREKPTTARVFIESTHPGTVERVTLYAYKYERAGAPCAPQVPEDPTCVAIPLSPASQPASAAIRVPINASADRGDLAKSGQVLLPEVWTREPRLFLKAATHGARLSCHEPADLTPEKDCMVGVTLKVPEALAPPGDAPPLLIRQRPIEWDDLDTDNYLDVRADDMVQAFNAAVLHVPAKVGAVGGGVTLDFTGWTRARRTAGQFVPDSPWWQARITANCGGVPACLNGTARNEETWLTTAEADSIDEFSSDMLRELWRRRSMTCNATTCPAPSQGIWAGHYHLPTMRRGRAWGAHGTLLEDVGARFQADYVTGAHEMMHSLGRKHTDYCIAETRYRPMCDEPYAYELRVLPSRTFPGQVTYPGGLTHPPMAYLPALGPIGTGMDRSEVWGLDPGLRRERFEEVIFPRGTSEVTIHLAPRALDPRYNVSSPPAGTASRPWRGL